MPTKGTGQLQTLGKYLACKLKHTNPFPFLPIKIEHWASLPYVVDADINIIKNILQDSQFNRRQLVKIIHYARIFMQQKSLDCTCFIDLNTVL